MVQINHNVDTDTPPPDLIPKAKYEIHICSSGRPDGKNYIALTWEIVSGEEAGRKTFEVLNIWWVSPEGDEKKEKQTRSMARTRLTEICNALGLGEISDSSELEGITCYGDIDTQPGSKGYGPSSRVGNVYPLKAKAGSAAAPAADGKSKPTWMKGKN